MLPYTCKGCKNEKECSIQFINVKTGVVYCRFDGSVLVVRV